MIESTELAAQPLNADHHLQYTQALRRRLIQGMMPDPVQLANLDPKVANVILAAMKDMDRVTLTLKRIDAEKETADADRAALDQFHRLSAMTGSKDLLQTPEAEGATVVAPAFDPADIPSTSPVEGELRRGADPTDYDHFMEKERQRRRASLEESEKA